MPLELQQLRQVIALAEHGSFVRAAAALHISQPALSRSVRGLEQRFGNDLFVRTSSGVVPTDVGRLYIGRARDVLRLANELDREAVAGHPRAGEAGAAGEASTRTTRTGRERNRARFRVIRAMIPSGVGGPGG